jgi:fructokinase
VKIISMGEVLWDIFDDQELLGGAPLNISASLQRLGHSVSLVTGVGTDARGERTLERMAKLCLSTEFVRRAPDRETGTARVTLNGLGQATFVIPRPAAFDSLQGDAALLSRLQALGSEWLYFGTLAQTDALNCELVEQMFEQLSGIRGFYDMNLREGHWNLPLVQRLSSLANVVKLNEDEAEILSRLIAPQQRFLLEHFCREWSARHSIEVICVTLGGAGCAVFAEDTLQVFPGYKVQVVDTVGAGDAFAAGYLHALAQPWPMETKAAFANALGALVASRAGATPQWSFAECRQLMAEEHRVSAPEARQT